MTTNPTNQHAPAAMGFKLAGDFLRRLADQVDLALDCLSPDDLDLVTPKFGDDLTLMHDAQVESVWRDITLKAGTVRVDALREGSKRRLVYRINGSRVKRHVLTAFIAENCAGITNPNGAPLYTSAQKARATQRTSEADTANDTHFKLKPFSGAGRAGKSGARV